MKDRYSENIKDIQSDKIRSISEYLYEQNTPITYFGKAWEKCSNNWIYFDTVLDLEKLRKLFELNEHIIIHENTDPKSGTEKGFIDNITGEGLMGKII